MIRDPLEEGRLRDVHRLGLLSCRHTYRVSSELSGLSGLASVADVATVRMVGRWAFVVFGCVGQLRRAARLGRPAALLIQLRPRRVPDDPALLAKRMKGLALRAVGDVVILHNPVVRGRTGEHILEVRVPGAHPGERPHADAPRAGLRPTGSLLPRPGLTGLRPERGVDLSFLCLGLGHLHADVVAPAVLGHGAAEVVPRVPSVREAAIPGVRVRIEIGRPVALRQSPPVDVPVVEVVLGLNGFVLQSSWLRPRDRTSRRDAGSAGRKSNGKETRDEEK